MELEEILIQSAHQTPDAPCFVTDDGVLTYGNAVQALQDHRNWLSRIVPSSVCSKKTTVVAYLSTNHADLILSVLACTSSSISALPALLNTRWTPSEMTSVLQSSDSSRQTCICYEEDFDFVAEQVVSLLQHRAFHIGLPNLSRAYVTQQHRPTVRSFSPPEFARPSNRSSIDDDALIVFTSGTTSGAKGVCLSHRALYVQAHAKLDLPCGYSDQTVHFATTVPFFHVGGLSSVLAVLLAGGCLVLSGTKFDPHRTAHVLAEKLFDPPVNTLVVVPAMLVALEQVISSEVYPSVRLILVGGQSASAAVRDFCSRAFPHARLVQTYACSEAASSLTFLEIPTTIGPSLLSSEQGDCVGKPPRHIELAVFDPEDHNHRVTNAHSVGIIATRGSHVMNGYWKGGKHLSVQRPDQWMMTNDLGYFSGESHDWYVCGRITDSIRTGGETVMATEVERAILAHPSVVECAVFGLPDDRFGEAVCAAVVCQPGFKVSMEELASWCAKQRLAGYKRPRNVFLVSELPKNTSGKVLKFVLVDKYAQLQRSKL